MTRDELIEKLREIPLNDEVKVISETWFKDLETAEAKDIKLVTRPASAPLILLVHMRN